MSDNKGTTRPAEGVSPVGTTSEGHEQDPAPGTEEVRAGNAQPGGKTLPRVQSGDRNQEGA